MPPPKKGPAPEAAQLPPATPYQDRYKTIRLKRDVIDRIDEAGRRVAVYTDVPKEGVRVSRSFLIDRALDLYEEYLDRKEAGTE